MRRVQFTFDTQARFIDSIILAHIKELICFSIIRCKAVLLTFKCARYGIFKVYDVFEIIQ